MCPQATADATEAPTRERRIRPGPYDVFVAYSRHDARPFVVRLVRSLEDLGLNVFVDFDDIREGADEWEEEISRGLALSHVFAFVVSPRSVTSKECAFELDRATAYGKRILTVIRTHPEQVGESGLDERLRKPQWLAFTDDRPFDECVGSLVQALRVDSEWLQEQTRLLIRANRWADDQRKRHLLRWGELRAAEKWRREQPDAPGLQPTELQNKFIDASRRYLQRLVIGSLAAALAVTAGLAIWALVAERSANSERRIAESRALATAALVNLTSSPESSHSDPELSVVLAREAMKIHRTREAETALRQSLAMLGPVPRSLVGHTGPLRDAAFSPTGGLVATAALDGTARVWSTSSGRQLHCFRGGGGLGLTSAAFSPNGSRIAVGGLDGTIRIWKASAGGSCPGPRATTPALATLTAPPRAGRQTGTLTVDFSPDGRRLLTSHQSGVAYIWDLGTRGRVATFAVHKGVINSAAFSSDGRRVVTAGGDGLARVWTVGGAQLSVLNGHAGAVERAAFSPDGQRVATVGEDGTARVWTLGSHQPPAELRVGFDKLYTVAFSPSGKEVLVGGFDSSARIWAPATDTITELRGHADAIASARFDTTGDRVVTASFDDTARIWQLRTQLRHRRAVETSRFSPDDRSVLTASRDGIARLWAVPPMGTAPSPPVELRGTTPLNGADFSRDGSEIATAGQDGTVLVWSAQSRRVIARLPGGSPIKTASFSPDGKRVVTADGVTTRIWDVGAHRVVGHLRVPKPPNGAAFSPDGKLVVVAGGDNDARIWSLSAQKAPLLLSGHLGPVRSAAFDPTSRFVVTASDDGTVRIWNARTGRQVQRLRGHTAAARSASFSDDGNLVVSTGEDGTARLWDVASGTLLSLFSVRGQLNDADIQKGGALVTAGDDGAALYECVVCEPVDVLVQSAAKHVPRSLTPGERKKYL